MSKKEKLGGPSIPRLLNFDHGPSWLTLPLVLALASPPPATAQLADPPTAAYDKKSMSIIMGVVVIVFFLSVFLSLYSRQCAHRRHTPIRRHLDLAFPIGSTRPTAGLDPEIIQSFPSFLYSTVKGRGALACAVCLNEYEDDETLCLIPKCSHVFHPDCINAWLASHYTCPVCRANLLVPAQKDTSFLALEIPDPSHSDFQQQNESDRNVESPKVNLLHRSGTMNQNHGPSRSRSTGFLMAILFPRSHSTGHTDTVVQPGEDWDRFTLRLQQPNSSSTLKRTKSCVTFARMSSGRRGYRTRSVGSARGRNYLQLQYDRFASNTLTNRPPLHLMDNVDEASSDRLYPT